MTPTSWNPDDWLNIPDEFKSRKQWMVCKEDKHPLKVGCDWGNAVDPNCWSTFVDAYLYALEHRMWIGYCLSAADPFTAIDFDHYRRNKELIDRICAQLNTYFEWSMSGNGLHAWLYGNIGKGRTGKDQEGQKVIEVYSQNRFMVMTGNVANAVPILDDQEWLQGLVATLPEAVEVEEIEDQPAIESDEMVCERVMGSMYAKKFRTLVSADWEREYSDPSTADYAFANIMAEFTPSNQQIWSMFSQTQLGKRLKNGNIRHPNSINFLTNACAKARTRVNAEQAIMLDETMLYGAASNYVNGLNGHIASPPINGGIQAPAINGFPLQIRQQKTKEIPHFIGHTEEAILQRPDIDWVLKHVITRGELAVMWGEPKSGKSFLAMDLAYAVSLGNSWFGYRTTQMPVAYLMLEGNKGLKQRIEARRKHWGITEFNPNIEFFDHNFDLVDQHQYLAEHLNRNGKFKGLIVIDTLSRATPTMDENQSSDMGRIIAAAEMLEQETDSTTLMVHHSTKSKDNPTMRGHSRLLGAVSTLEVVRGRVENEGIWSPGEIKESGAHTENRFKLHPITLKLDSDGDMVGSCVVVPLPPFEEDGTGESEPPMGGARSRRQYNRMNGNGSGGAGRPKWSSVQQQRMIREVEKLAWNTEVRKGCKAIEYWKITQAIGTFLPDGADAREKRDLLRAFNKMVSEGCFEREKVGEVEWLWKV